MPKRKKTNIGELKREARGRFETFIAAELDTQTDVGTDSLALNFYNREEPLLRKIAHSTLITILVKWADDILGQSIARENARKGHIQLLLPMSLQGIQMPGAYSFINGANKRRFVANYKAELFHLESHAYILHKLEGEIRDSCQEHERLVSKVKPVMEAGAKTLADAFQWLRDREAGAA
ncbi:MAG TPA: hypothetical protein VI455_04155 [Terriglobia bacterium]